MNLNQIVGSINLMKRTSHAFNDALCGLIVNYDFHSVKTLYKRNQSLFYEALRILSILESFQFESDRERVYFEALNNYINSLIRQSKAHAIVTYHIWQQSVDSSDYLFHSENLKQNFALYNSVVNDGFVRFKLIYDYK